MQQTRNPDAGQDVAQSALLENVRHGEERAWRELYRRLFHPLYHYFYHRCGGSVQDAEDMIQETMVSIVRAIQTYDPAKQELLPWAYGVAHRRWVDYVRKKSLRPNPAWLAERFEQEPLPEDVVAREEFRVTFGSVLSRLPDKYREILRLKYVDDRSLQELTAQLGLTLDAVKSLLIRAKDALRCSLNIKTLQN